MYLKKIQREVDIVIIRYKIRKRGQTCPLTDKNKKIKKQKIRNKREIGFVCLYNTQNPNGSKIHNHIH